LESAHPLKRHSISVHQAASFAWPAFKRYYRLFTTGLLAIFAAWVALEIVVIAGQQFGILVWALAHIAFLIFFAGIEVGLIKISFAVYDGQEPTFSDLFAHLALGLKFLAGQLLYGLIIVVGLVLLLVPGFYLGVRYAWFGFCMADGEANMVESFRESAIMSAGQTASFLAIFAALLVFNLLGASLLGLGLLVTIPLSLLMLSAVYRQLSVR
jgi:hypothetical protein